MKFRLERLPRDENFPAAAIAGTNLYYFFSSRGPHNKMILCHILRNILQELPPERARKNKCYCLKSWLFVIDWRPFWRRENTAYLIVQHWHWATKYGVVCPSQGLRSCGPGPAQCTFMYLSSTLHPKASTVVISNAGSDQNFKYPSVSAAAAENKLRNCVMFLCRRII